ncbi:3-methyladenine DNA glycosylase [Rhodococcus ruber Chol-4]|uniref:DNA-3-methyladenine glycosylase n=1 Tax=Rhodococcus TaxID=1827 RepID=UPI00029B31FC|nr:MULTISPECIES: DNA-3-methyladenine glycosylase [Rhodococcus]MDO2380218.1 DNA-3-methyladenine glycosylase [Rhodococcus ruber]MDX5455746.1 DNA-3-methyladenine glycosylase [Rhodococcus sp. (in: high G+C Gram-positive bacteria)]RIK11256.1 MAG: DNA-3-methyladenine glycosylase [Acidobacteriota bacterium]ATQ27972.1 DNA-3-methyladenine glycosylase [Rhodococcus ruber]AXY52461.1 3-methyladenine DNA glycosylase [Rhodococcus ruber]
MAFERLTAVDPLKAAHTILGATLCAGEVVLRITEVEAYGGPEDGPWPDPAAHSYRGRTPRNAVMFGPAGHLYVYRSYGLHHCANISVGADGVAAAVLLRGAEVVAGEETVRARRTAGTPASNLARGPGNLAEALGLTLADNGIDVLDEGASVRLTLGDAERVAAGPRVGISVAAERPWRLWIPGAVGVSAYRRSPRAPAAPRRMG